MLYVIIQKDTNISYCKIPFKNTAYEYKITYTVVFPTAKSNPRELPR